MREEKIDETSKNEKGEARSGEKKAPCEAD